MGFWGKIWKGIKGVGKWAVKYPETVNAGMSIFDARKHRKAQRRDSLEKDYTLSNLNERINQLQDALAEEISSVRDDIYTVASDLQQEYTTRLDAFSQQLEDIRIAQIHQARAVKRMAIVYGCVTIAVLIGLVAAFLF